MICRIAFGFRARSMIAFALGAVASCRDYSPPSEPDPGLGGSLSIAGASGMGGGRGDEGGKGGESSVGGSPAAGGGDAGGEGGEDGRAPGGSGGSGGDRGDDEGGSAGASGAAGARCTEDVDCDDGAACTGTEQCVEGACQPGSPVTCPEAELVCRESDDRGACEYRERSPWVFFYGIASTPFFAIGLFGVPAAYAVSMTPKELTRAAVARDGEAAIDYRVSPSGNHVLLNVAGEGRAVYAFDLGKGAPSEATPIPNLPRDEGQYSITWFAPGTECTVAQERTLLFQICFEPGGPVASLVSDQATPDLALDWGQYCSGATAFLASSQLFDLRASNREPEPAAGFEVSPNGERMARPIPGALELRACALSSATMTLPVPIEGDDAELSWAPDSRHALVEACTDAGDACLIDVDAAADPVIARFTPTDPDDWSYSFSADSKYLLIRDGATSSLLTVVDGTPVALSVPAGADSIDWTDDRSTLEMRRPLVESVQTAAVWLATPGGAPELVHETDDASVEVVLSTRTGLALIVTGASEPVVSRLDLANIAAGPRSVAALGEIGPLSTVKISPDGSGALITRAGETQEDIYWLSLRGDHEGELAYLNKGNSGFAEFQPWP